MKARHKTTVIAAIVVVLCLAAAVAILHPLEETQVSGDAANVLYVPSARAIRALSLGYSGLAADIYWTRAVQYFGRGHQEHAETYPLLAPLLQLTTELDPHLIVAYQFGGVFLSAPSPEGAGEPDKAVALVERGISANPENWQLYLSLGFIQYQQRHDVAAALDAFERGSRVPNAHPALKVLAAVIAQQGGEQQKAAILWRAILDTTTDATVRKNASQHLIALHVDSDVTQLEALIHDFEQRNGRLPSNLGEMVASGWLKGIPVDPLGDPYHLMPDGRVEVERPSELPFITKGLPPGMHPKLSLPTS